MTAVAQARAKKTKKKPVSQPATQKRRMSREIEVALVITALLLTLGLRLIRIDSPLLDFHAHRQTQTASNAEGFAEHTFNLFRPTFLLIDANGKAPGETDMEFPLFQYIIGMLWRIFGQHDFLGRLMSAGFGVGVAGYLYLLTKRYFGTIAATGATAFYAINPVAVFFNRTFQPDTMGLFFFIGGIYHLGIWFERRTKRDIVTAALLTALGLLLRPPVLVILAPWVLYELYKNEFWKAEHRRDLLIFLGASALIAIAIAAWYIHSYVNIFNVTGLTMIRGRGLNPPVRTTEFWFSSMLYIETLKRIWLILTPIGAILLAAALVPINRHPKGRAVTMLFIGYLLYFILVAEYNLPHYYYQLPLIPIAAMFVGWLAGWAIDYMRQNEVAAVVAPMTLILAFTGMGWLSYTTSSPWYRIDHAPFWLDAAAKVKAITGPGARIYANNAFFGEFTYYTGSYQPYVKWSKAAGRFIGHDGEYDLATRQIKPVPMEKWAPVFGVKYVAWLKHQDWPIQESLPKRSRLLADEPNFALWRLPEKPSADAQQEKR